MRRGRVWGVVLVLVALGFGSCGADEAAQEPPTTRSSNQQATTTVSEAATTTTNATSTTAAPDGDVAMVRGQDQDTGKAVINITVARRPTFGGPVRSVVRLYQDGRVLGQVWFESGWEDDELLAYFRTDPAPADHEIKAVAVTVDSAGRTLDERSSPPERWPVTISPGQVVELR